MRWSAFLPAPYIQQTAAAVQCWYTSPSSYTVSAYKLLQSVGQIWQAMCTNRFSKRLSCCDTVQKHLSHQSKLSYAAWFGSSTVGSIGLAYTAMPQYSDPTHGILQVHLIVGIEWLSPRPVTPPTPPPMTGNPPSVALHKRGSWLLMPLRRCCAAQHHASLISGAWF